MRAPLNTIDNVRKFAAPFSPSPSLIASIKKKRSPINCRAEEFKTIEQVVTTCGKPRATGNGIKRVDPWRQRTSNEQQGRHSFGHIRLCNIA